MKGRTAGGGDERCRLSDTKPKWERLLHKASISQGLDAGHVDRDRNSLLQELDLQHKLLAPLVPHDLAAKTGQRAANDAGQNLLQQVTQATGGKSFWQGSGNPVSFQDYFNDLSRRFRNQYELGFTSPPEGKAAVEQMNLKLHAPGTEIDAPQRVLVVPGGQN